MIKKIMHSLSLLLLLSICNHGIAHDAVPNSRDQPFETTKESSVLTILQPKTDDLYYSGRERYFLDIMMLALNKTPEPYSIKEVILETHTESRGAQLVKNGVYSIHWFHTNTHIEKLLLPIRIPLFKGLIGWRLLFIHQSMTNKFKKITSLQELKKLRALQGLDWPDTAVLRDNGFKVDTSRNVDSLFRMLKHGRGDYFPRGVVEIWQELQDFPNMELVVEEQLVIQYPAAYYFFVAKDNLRLKERLEKGLNIAILDGSFDKLFMKHFGDIIQRSNLSSRNILSIENPNIPPKTPLSRPELWFSIKMNQEL